MLAAAWNEKRGAFTGAFGDDDLDASLLLLPEIGLVEPDDPRFIRTLDAIQRELLRDKQMMRYASADDFGFPKSAFLICRFWLIDALWWVGRKEQARELFNDALNHRNRYGLLSEDIHPATGKLWGNFPQTYSMAGLILTAMRLSRTWEDRYWRGESVVSNRVPVNGGEDRAGGLEVALSSALKGDAGVWFGWSGDVVANDEVKTRSCKREGMTYIVTDLSEENYQEYYNGFANRVLWPILHYRLDLAEFNRRELGGYIRVNRHFAGELSKFLTPTDAVWVHDYHLIPVADELRRRGHENRIGFFLHVPFPAAEIISVLPNHERLIPQLLNYDVVGFQTESDVANFMRYIITEGQRRGDTSRVFEAVDQQLVFSQGGRRTRIGAFPVGIDTQAFARMAQRAAQSKFVKELLDSLGDQALVIGVDRLDYSKGLVERTDAFDRFFSISRSGEEE